MKQAIRGILQGHLVDLGKFNTAWEGVNNQVALPYQSVYLSVSTADTATISDKPLAVETGFLQVTLFYPNGKGTASIEARAALIRDHFYGQSIIDEDIQVVIHQPPMLGGIFLVDDKLALPITIHYTAYELNKE
ncbi:phage tail terminator-like protein [Actinobacillus porcinus]|uniref:phage tail terminator-like protein n=1 Tax=Actinobacillus porcinus TaxID=51048 RepID=UPI00235207E6|nr:phage tail terminator-like protein [Actinobacillus porcinus]MDD7545575.1 phage tail terminator-like protein [Actinobacillus porcinus]MDY5847632.1 phage tail terminator-like protein [Actinobacillus porcinus]